MLDEFCTAEAEGGEFGAKARDVCDEFLVHTGRHFSAVFFGFQVVLDV